MSDCIQVFSAIVRAESSRSTRPCRDVQSVTGLRFCTAQNRCSFQVIDFPRFSLALTYIYVRRGSSGSSSFVGMAQYSKGPLFVQPRASPYRARKSKAKTPPTPDATAQRRRPPGRKSTTRPRRPERTTPEPHGPEEQHPSLTGQKSNTRASGRESNAQASRAERATLEPPVGKAALGLHRPKEQHSGLQSGEQHSASRAGRATLEPPGQESSAWPHGAGRATRGLPSRESSARPHGPEERCSAFPNRKSNARASGSREQCSTSHTRGTTLGFSDRKSNARASGRERSTRASRAGRAVPKPPERENDARASRDGRATHDPRGAGEQHSTSRSEEQRRTHQRNTRPHGRTVGVRLDSGSHRRPRDPRDPRHPRNADQLASREAEHGSPQSHPESPPRIAQYRTRPLRSDIAPARRPCPQVPPPRPLGTSRHLSAPLDIRHSIRETGAAQDGRDANKITDSPTERPDS